MLSNRRWPLSAHCKPRLPPPPPPKQAAKPASPRGNPGTWVTPDDYPSRALREEREGTNGFKLAIDANGKVVDCQITSSSGSPDLDAEDCKNLMRRARFRPAEDTDGNAMASSYSSSVVWQIPQNRKRVAEGKRVSEAVDLGGRRFSKKKKQKKKI